MQNLKLNADLVAGLLFAAFGAWFGASSIFGLSLGTAFRMGPGFFPALVGGLLFALGLVIALKGWRAEHETLDLATVPWRAVILFPVGLTLFGLSMRPLGLIIALLVLCLCSSMAVKGMSAIRAVILSLAVTVLCIGIFSVGLGLDLPLLGDWLR
ncbi:tripartite tricarboxylate transporter TctB family protein [Pelagibacterium mangrovi]|uniref:tripartite tricarboxylate transporter TctB family protein n=1 Tax=Pelagibacterium mangrovi TaxID=3119828 RepID=UPI002FC78AD7